jgi:hypothetical protein
MNTWKEAGRGRKNCPACNIYVAVRASKCVCDHQFYATKPKPKREEDEIKDTIEFPAGACPSELTGTDRATVLAWCRDIWVHYQHQKQKIAISALRYYVRHFYNIASEEYKIVCSHINTLENSRSIDV